MAIKGKMFEVAESKNMKGVHIINIIKEVFKRDSHCTEHLKAKTCREENSGRQRLQQTRILPKLLAFTAGFFRFSLQDTEMSQDLRRIPTKGIHYNTVYLGLKLHLCVLCLIKQAAPAFSL